MKNTRKRKRPLSADAIARLADKGQDVSRFFTKFSKRNAVPRILALPICVSVVAVWDDCPTRQPSKSPLNQHRVERGTRRGLIPFVRRVFFAIRWLQGMSNQL